MTMPDDKRKKSPADRFRSILSAEQDKDGGSTARSYPKNTASPAINNLPKPNAQTNDQAQMAEIQIGRPEARVSGPGVWKYLPAFWTIASVISLVVNIVLAVVVLGLLRSFGSLDTARIGTGVLGGLYSNFERMDQAHIKTTIPIQTNIPLDLNVPVQTTTAITLAKNVSIPGAHVRINTALVSIDAPANVTLPAGTSLDVTMAFTLPVQAQVPVSLSVPIDIPLQQTDLHPALVGLQDTIRPVYCIVTPLAQGSNGELICK
jgi:hypothetical protein